VAAGETPVLVHNDSRLEGCKVNVNTRTVVDSGGNNVKRYTVANEDDLLGVAEHLAGGSLDNFAVRKPDFWRGQLPDGTHREIEFNLEGHPRPMNEGPHVKLLEPDDPMTPTSKSNKWRVVLKVFIEGREEWGQ